MAPATVSSPTPPKKLAKLRGPPKLLKKIHKAVQKKKMGVGVLLSFLDKNNNGLLEPSEFIRGLKAHDVEVKEKHIEAALKTLTGNTSGPVPLRLVEEKYHQYEYSSLSSSSEERPKLATHVKLGAVEGVLTHFSYELQLHRVLRENAVKSLVAEYRPDTEISLYSLNIMLRNSLPQSVNEEDIQELCKFLLQKDKGDFTPENEYKANASVLQQRLNKQLDSWEVFSQEDEEEFDRVITEMLNKNLPKLSQACEDQDLQRTGSLPLEAFKNLLSSLDCSMPPRVLHYLTLLSYSQNRILHTVPYESILKAYGSSLLSMSEGEKLSLIKNQIYGIIHQLSTKALRLREVFVPDSRGFLAKEGFLQGLDRLSVVQGDQLAIELTLEALRDEDHEDEFCIDFRQFKGIMIKYGLPQSSAGTESPKSPSHRTRGQHAVSQKNSFSYEEVGLEAKESSSDHPNSIFKREKPQNESYSARSVESKEKRSESSSIKIEDSPVSPLRKEKGETSSSSNSSVSVNSHKSKESSSSESSIPREKQGINGLAHNSSFSENRMPL